jgi:hypothetical protein
MMLMNLRLRLVSSSLLLASFGIACSEKSQTTSTSADGGSLPTGNLWPVLDEGADEGEACIYHTDCSTQYCLRYSDVPLDPDRQCARGGNMGDMRVTATVRDLSTRDTVGNASVSVVSAFAAAGNPVAARANAIATVTADDTGVVDGVAADVNSTPLGVVALTSADDYFLTATGLGAPFSGTTDYPAGNSIHDLWLVSADTLDSWSSLLAADTALATALPLGERGGVIAFVRDVMTGEPIAGAVVRSERATSSANVRYLAEDGASFSEDQTSEQGIAIILSPGLGENFGAYLDEVRISTNLAGSAPNAIMVVTMQNAP